MNATKNKGEIFGQIFLFICAILIVGTIGFAFWQTVVVKNYTVIAEVSCDPNREACFRFEPEPCSENDADCILEEAYDYKIIHKRADVISACEQTEEKLGCGDELSCLEGEAGCFYTECTEESLNEGEACSEPYPDEPAYF